MRRLDATGHRKTTIKNTAQVRVLYSCETDWPISQSNLLVKSCKDRLAALHICCLYGSQNWQESWEDKSCSTLVWKPGLDYWYQENHKRNDRFGSYRHCSPSKADASAVYPGNGKIPQFVAICHLKIVIVRWSGAANQGGWGKSRWPAKGPFKSETSWQDDDEQKYKLSM